MNIEIANQLFRTKRLYSKKLFRIEYVYLKGTFGDWSNVKYVAADNEEDVIREYGGLEGFKCEFLSGSFTIISNE